MKEDLSNDSENDEEYEPLSKNKNPSNLFKCISNSDMENLMDEFYKSFSTKNLTPDLINGITHIKVKFLNDAATF